MIEKIFPAMADDKKKEDTDPRLDYISSYVTKTFRIKSDKWQKLIISEEKVTMTPTVAVPVGYAITFFQPFRRQTVIFDWLNDPKMERLCFGIGSSGGLTVFSNFPNTTKSKICYFLRKMPIALTADNIKSVS